MQHAPVALQILSVSHLGQLVFVRGLHVGLWSLHGRQRVQSDAMPFDIDNSRCRTEDSEEQVGERTSESTPWGAHSRLEKVQTWCYLDLSVRWRGHGLMEVLLAW